MKYVCLVYLEEQKLHAIPDRECKTCGDGFRKSGLLIAAEALEPVRTAVTVRVRNGKMSVVDGPFAETKELVAGYWLWQVRSKEEAIDWVKRCPNPFPNTDSEIEIRQVFEADDFGPELTPELREQEARLLAQVAGKKQAGERCDS